MVPVQLLANCVTLFICLNQFICFLWSLAANGKPKRIHSVWHKICTNMAIFYQLLTHQEKKKELMLVLLYVLVARL